MCAGYYDHLDRFSLPHPVPINVDAWRWYSIAPQDKRTNEGYQVGKNDQGITNGTTESGASYHAGEETYFESRGLRRYAGVWSLWALGVGAVISGDFFGWNFGLAAGGFGGLLVATVIVAAMYVSLCYCIAEMSPALPHTGGAYSFARGDGGVRCQPRALLRLFPSSRAAARTLQPPNRARRGHAAQRAWFLLGEHPLPTTNTSR